MRMDVYYVEALALKQGLAEEQGLAEARVRVGWDGGYYLETSEKKYAGPDREVVIAEQASATCSEFPSAFVSGSSWGLRLPRRWWDDK